VGGLSRARLHQRLETPPTICFQGKIDTFSVKLPFFSRIYSTGRKVFRGVFFESRLKQTLKRLIVQGSFLLWPTNR